MQFTLVFKKASKQALDRIQTVLALFLIPPTFTTLLGQFFRFIIFVHTVSQLLDWELVLSDVNVEMIFVCE